ncbi:hypothetical protein BVX98_05205 [bacterium F11]|nr:hypothetical protein BVX98_05205 [bacterium F11]
MNQIIIRASLRNYQIGIAAGVVLLLLGIKMRATQPTGGILFILVGVALLAVSYYKLTNRRNIYILSSQGIEYCQTRIKPLPWKEIAASKKIEFEGSFYILLKVEQVSRFDSQLTHEESLLPAGAESVGINSLSLRITGTDANVDKILQLVRQRTSA